YTSDSETTARPLPWRWRNGLNGESRDMRRMNPSADPEAGRGMTRGVARRIANLFRPYKWRVLGAIGAILLTAGLGVINPYLLQVIIDDAIPNGDLSQLYLLVGLMIVLPIISGLIGVG